MTMHEKMRKANFYVAEALEELQKNPEVSAISELLAACEPIEMYYKQWCDEHDDETGDTPGNTYKHGTSLEFYIEADWWHDVSLALRKLKEKQ